MAATQTVGGRGAVGSAATAVSVTVLISAGLREELPARARRHGRTFSAELRRAAETYLAIDESMAAALLAGEEKWKAHA